MASPSPSSKSGSKVQPFRKSMLAWVLAVGLLVLLVGQFPIASGGWKIGSANPEPPKPVEQRETRVTKVVKYRLDSVKWTEWISLVELKPPEVPDDAKFEIQINAPKLYEARDWTEQPLFIRGDEERLMKWLGEISTSTFKLRGEGEAVLRITYIFSR